MRLLLLAAALVSVPATAQAISGTSVAVFEGFNEFGSPLTKLTLTLQCGLSCPPEAPELHYRVNGGTDAWYAGKRDERADSYTGAAFGNLSVNVDTDTGVKAGAAVVFISKSATCHCGNRIGEGGFIEIESNVMAVAPGLSASNIRVGDEEAIVVSAKPQGTDTVTVKLSGGGLDETRTLTPADFGTQDGIFVRFTATQAGSMTITATLQPYGAVNTRTITVRARDSGSTGGGSGGGSGGGGGSDDEPMGCSSTGVVSLLALGGLLLRRRAQ